MGGIARGLSQVYWGYQGACLGRGHKLLQTYNFKFKNSLKKFRFVHG